VGGGGGGGGVQAIQSFHKLCRVVLYPVFTEV